MKQLKLKMLFLTLVTAVPLLFLSGCEMVVFQPQGPVARSIMELINWSLMWMLLVVVVVFGLFGYIVWKYREKPENMGYEPPEDHGSTVLEIVWTAIPILIVIALTIPTVTTLYDLEDVPAGYEEEEPLVIHVTSADWKWIFSYPEEGIETVNYVNIPEDRPVLFKLTSAGTMQSFWVPALGGQKYSMNKMETELYLVADNPGSYMGRNTNFNGRGYAQMEFEVLAQTDEEYDSWVKEVKETAPTLTEEKYMELLKPTHLGRLTYNETHLAWINHADPDAELVTDPEDYRYHGYQGKIFDQEEKQSTEENNQVENNEEDHGGDHSGH